MKGFAVCTLAFFLLAARPLDAQSIPTDSSIRAMLKARVDSGRAKGIVVLVVPTSPERFFLKDVEAQILFDLGPTGKATGLTLLQGGAAPHATRTP